MEEGIYLKKYAINAESVSEIIEKRDFQELIIPLWWEVDIYDTYEVYEESLKPFTTEQRYFFAMEWCFAEVFNGGYGQFFTNSTGIVAEDALKGFEMIGYENGAAPLRKFKELMGGKFMYDRAEREDFFDSLTEDFYEKEIEPLEDALFEDGYDVYAHLGVEFIRKCPEKFFFEGEIWVPEGY